MSTRQIEARLGKSIIWRLGFFAVNGNHRRLHLLRVRMLVDVSRSVVSIKILDRAKKSDPNPHVRPGSTFVRSVLPTSVLLSLSLLHP